MSSKWCDFCTNRQLLHGVYALEVYAGRTGMPTSQHDMEWSKKQSAYSHAKADFKLPLHTRTHQPFQHWSRLIYPITIWKPQPNWSRADLTIVLISVKTSESLIKHSHHLLWSHREGKTDVWNMGYKWEQDLHLNNLHNCTTIPLTNFTTSLVCFCDSMSMMEADSGWRGWNLRWLPFSMQQALSPNSLHFIYSTFGDELSSAGC